VWEVSTGDTLATLGEQGGPGITAASWSDDESVLGTGAADGTVELWDGDTGEERFTLSGHTAAVTVIVWSEQGRLVTTSDDGTSRVWDGTTGEELLELTE
jgi:WD40 repeat protein